MAFIGRTIKGRFAVVWNGEILATYDTHAEQWFHITHGYPPESRQVAEKAAKLSASLWSSLK